MDFIVDNFIYLAPILGVFGLIVMFVQSSWVSKQDAGDKKMKELSNYIANILQL